MRILITGSNGLLGQKIVKQCLEKNYIFLATSKGENRVTSLPNEHYVSMDICNSIEIQHAIDSFKPTHVIHTAAITNVDYCEQHEEECTDVNVKAVELLFSICQRKNIHFQLLSTDFVFDGSKGNYSEDDQVGPLSVYAKSKVDAENILLSSTYLNWSILRTIIVYGDGENLSRSNIVLWAKDALIKGDELTIVDDQFRAPTWADDLAWACLRVCELNKKGIYHICGPETMSIYDLVIRIGKYFDLNTDKIDPIKSDTLNQAAKRPPKTGFNISKAKNELGYKPKTIEETLGLL